MKIATVSAPKQKFPRAAAQVVAGELVFVLREHCEPGYCVVAGSLRRQKEEVGDVEIQFVPRMGHTSKIGRLFSEPEDLAAKTILALCALKQLELRPNVRGVNTWGGFIKLARHTASGIPVDFFTATKENWFNYLVCRTGPAESNRAIARAAQRRGYKWKPYSPGFCRADDQTEKCVAIMHSEQEVFEFVGLEYREPKDR